MHKDAGGEFHPGGEIFSSRSMTVYFLSNMSGSLAGLTRSMPERYSAVSMSYVTHKSMRRHMAMAMCICMTSTVGAPGKK
jgi:hypothetical protein